MLVEIEDGRVLSVKSDPDNPDSQGFLCVRGQASKGDHRQPGEAAPSHGP